MGGETLKISIKFEDIPGPFGDKARQLAELRDELAESLHCLADLRAEMIFSPTLERFDLMRELEDVTDKVADRYKVLRASARDDLRALPDEQQELFFARWALGLPWKGEGLTVQDWLNYMGKPEPSLRRCYRLQRAAYCNLVLQSVAPWCELSGKLSP